MAGKSEKIVHVCSVNCPNCKVNIDILKKVKVITPAEKAVKEEVYYASKGLQKTLDEAS